VLTETLPVPINPNCITGCAVVDFPSSLRSVIFLASSFIFRPEVIRLIVLATPLMTLPPDLGVVLLFVRFGAKVHSEFSLSSASFLSFSACSFIVAALVCASLYNASIRLPSV